MAQLEEKVRQAQAEKERGKWYRNGGSTQKRKCIGKAGQLHATEIQSQGQGRSLSQGNSLAYRGV